MPQKQTPPLDEPAAVHLSGEEVSESAEEPVSGWLRDALPSANSSCRPGPKLPILESMGNESAEGAQAGTRRDTGKLFRLATFWVVNTAEDSLTWGETRE